MPRWLLPLLVVSLAVMAVIAARLIFFPPTNRRITAESFERIKKGMKRDEWDRWREARR
jgi:hypothetical protein